VSDESLDRFSTQVGNLVSEAVGLREDLHGFKQSSRRDNYKIGAITVILLLVAGLSAFLLLQQRERAQG
jgi:hypothetical protein